MKILITSDIHLGLGEPESPIPASARIATFKKIAALARDHDLLLIAGDLLDSEFHDPSLMKMLYSELDSLQKAGTEIILTPGPGECDKTGSILTTLYDLPFTRIFSNLSSTRVYSLLKQNQLVHIYGIPGLPEENFDTIVKTSDKGFHIGLFHARFEPNNQPGVTSIPVINNQIFKKLTLDFYAMGYAHNFKMFKINNKIVGVYPGSPEATSLNEKDDRYVISLIVENDAVSAIKRLSVNTYTVKNLIMDCGAFSSPEKLTESIIAASSTKTCGIVTLEGNYDYQLSADMEKDLERYFYFVSIVRNCFSSINALINEYAGEKSLRGDFFYLLEQELDQGLIPGTILPEPLTKILNELADKRFSSLEDLL